MFLPLSFLPSGTGVLLALAQPALELLLFCFMRQSGGLVMALPTKVSFNYILDTFLCPQLGIPARTGCPQLCSSIAVMNNFKNTLWAAANKPEWGGKCKQNALFCAQPLLLVP